MCGITGYLAKNAPQFVISALKMLEYRGYDSAGIATSNSKITIKKTLDGIDELGKNLKTKGNVAIGHTRWATHGKVSLKNTHPFTDCKKRVAIVHNGIITNWESLKKKMKNHKFSSETDSEIIAHLIGEQIEHGNTLLDACAKASKKLKGSFAFLAIEKGKKEIVGVCNESPLIVGEGDKIEGFSSDINAFPIQIEKIARLKDKEIAYVGRDKIELFDFNLKKQKIKWEEMEKKRIRLGEIFEHHTIKEIFEQPKVIFNVNMNEIKNAKKLLKSKRIVILACGSSKHAGEIGAREMFEKLKKEVKIEDASEIDYSPVRIDKNTVIIAVSQSGETADVLRVVKKAKGKGAKILSIINNPYSTLEKLSDYSIHLNCGQEIGVGATKSFLMQVLIFKLLSGERIDLKILSRELSKTIKGNLSRIKRISKWMAKKRDAYFIGKGKWKWAAMEGALKLKELSYIHAEGLGSGELKHGPLALIEKNSPLIAVGDNDSASTWNNAYEAKTRGAKIIGIAPRAQSFFDIWLKTSARFPLMSAAVNEQLLAYYTAVANKINPDRPKNLAKSVTVL